MRLNALALMAAVAAASPAFADDNKPLGRFTPGNDDTNLVHHGGYYGGYRGGYYGGFRGGYYGGYGYYGPGVSFYYGPAYYPAPVYYAPSYYYAPAFAYPRVYIGISGGTAPTLNLALRPAAADSSDPAQMQPTMPPPYAAPSFRYDGGPANPVPMPAPDRGTQPQDVPAAEVKVSLPPQAPKPALHYPAYGDK